MKVSHCTQVPYQSRVEIHENSDGQVTIVRTASSDMDECELTIHEWYQLRDDIKAGLFDDVRNGA